LNTEYTCINGRLYGASHGTGIPIYGETEGKVIVLPGSKYLHDIHSENIETARNFRKVQPVTWPKTEAYF
jgi:hypothetical protein